MSAIACCYEGCGASVCFTPELEQRLRQSHEWWMCPFGHQQHFAKATEQEMLRREAEKARDRWRAIFEEQDEVFGTCPFCGWQTRSHYTRRWLYLLRHFAKTHGATVEDFGPGTHPVYAMQQAQESAA